MCKVCSVVDPTTPPPYLQLPAHVPLGAAGNTQVVSLNEEVMGNLDEIFSEFDNE